MSGACPITRFRSEVSALSSQAASLPVRLATLAYGVVAYGAFLATILYAMGFMGDWIVPKTINSGTGGSLASSLLINAGLLMIFVVQHTVMARPAFKRWVTRVIPRSIERSTFVLAACASLGVLFLFWQPLPGVLWEAEATWLKWALSFISLSGWAIVLAASFMVSHFDLFGLRQVWMRFRNTEYRPVGFRLVGLYRLVRHPLMLGFLIAFWATPVMTVGHLFFAVMVSLYIAMGVWFEERDLMAEHGAEYGEYRSRVRAVIPVPRRAARGRSVSASVERAA